jgi:signal transduction histidine kinase
VSELVDQLMAVMQPVAEQKSQKLTSDLPQVPCALSCDRDRIYQVLANLLGNAIKFTPKNGQIRLHVEVVRDEVVFSVKDSGPGILPHEIPHVFDRYWQGPSSQCGGLGLGLAIAKDIVQAHSGRIWLECEPGCGSTFYAAFPVGA